MTATVLIADADQDLCDLYGPFFTRQGWNVQISAGGLECLSQLRKRLPQLLILDLQLPWGGADGLLAIMRADPTLSRVPVILTLADASPGILSRLTSPPVVHALWKPFSLTDLLDIVRTRFENTEAEPRTEGWEPACHGLS
jgi:DNA-binding NtrC family response regulator